SELHVKADRACRLKTHVAHVRRARSAGMQLERARLSSSSADVHRIPSRSARYGSYAPIWSGVLFDPLTIRSNVVLEVLSTAVALVLAHFDMCILDGSIALRIDDASQDLRYGRP